MVLDDRIESLRNDIIERISIEALRLKGIELRSNYIGWLFDAEYLDAIELQYCKDGLVYADFSENLTEIEPIDYDHMMIEQMVQLLETLMDITL